MSFQGNPEGSRGSQEHDAISSDLFRREKEKKEDNKNLSCILRMIFLPLFLGKDKACDQITYISMQVQITKDNLILKIHMKCWVTLSIKVALCG